MIPRDMMASSVSFFWFFWPRKNRERRVGKLVPDGLPEYCQDIANAAALSNFLANWPLSLLYHPAASGEAEL